jgi:hypothetical protein
MTRTERRGDEQRMVFVRTEATMGPKFPKPVRAQKPPKVLKRGAHMKRTASLKPKRWGIAAHRPHRMDRQDREVMVNDFDGTGPRMETKPGANEARLEWCRYQPCQRCGRVSTDEHPTQAAHEGRTGKGMSTKCLDDETFPLCDRCHREWTAGQSTNGFARHWDKAKRREWADEQVALATSRYFSAGARRSQR